MKLLISLFILKSSLAMAAGDLIPLKGTLKSFDKKTAKIVNLTGTYEVPVEYFSDLKKMEVGSEVILSLDESQNKNLIFTPPQEIEVKQNSPKKSGSN